MAESFVLNPGDTFIDKFKIDKKVADGSLGDSVYKGQNVSNKRQVFIRILPADLTTDKEFVDRFFQEIKFTSYFNHPHILKAVETGKEKDCYYLVTSFTTGQYLDKYLQKYGTISTEKALPVIRTLADALGYAWKNNKILHRNLTPGTIMINNEGEGILTDFGLAKKLSAKHKSLTMTGASVGNPSYMSPEQFDEETTLDCRSDIYCLGLLFYQMLTGQHPFEGKATMDLIEAHLKETPPLLHETHADIPQKVALVVDKMIKKDRDERYEDWDVLIRDIDEILANRFPPSIYDEDGNVKESERKPAKTKSTDSSEKSSSKTGLIVFIVILLLLVIGGAAAYFLLFNK